MITDGIQELNTMHSTLCTRVGVLEDEVRSLKISVENLLASESSLKISVENLLASEFSLKISVENLLTSESYFRLEYNI